MGLFDGIDLLNEQIGDVKDTTKELLDSENKKWELTPEGRRSMNAEAYGRGEITLDEFIRREKEATFSISKEEWNKLSLIEQNELYKEHPDKIRKLLGE